MPLIIRQCRNFASKFSKSKVTAIKLRANLRVGPLTNPLNFTVEHNAPYPTLSALPKLPVYAALGVPELWRYDGEQLYVYQLVDKEYIRCQNNPTFAPIKVAEIPHFLQESQRLGEVKMAKVFRQWVREQV